MTGDIGIKSDEFESVVNRSNDYFDKAVSCINKISDSFDEIKHIFVSNDMAKVAQNLETISESYSNVKSVVSGYTSSLEDVKKSYIEQSEAIANSLNRTTI